MESKDSLMKVAVLDTTQKWLATAASRHARLLLKKGEAAVFRRRPFTIICVISVGWRGFGITNVISRVLDAHSPTVSRLPQARIPLQPKRSVYVCRGMRKKDEGI